MSSIQLTFNLRTSPGCKTVHLLGNWDNYRGQLPLSKDSSSSKSGAWRGTFKFNGSSLQQGQRYWYYYIIDGYHATHDPAHPSTIEPTTKRELNILDVPTTSSHSSTTSSSRHRDHAGPAISLSTRSGQTSSRYTSTTRAPPGSKSHSPPRHSSSKHPSGYGLGITYPAQGRSLSPSAILHPRPQKPHATRGITTACYSHRDVDALTRQMARTQVSSSSFSSSESGSSIESDSDSEIDSDGHGYGSDPPSLSSGSSSRNSPGGSSRGSSSPSSSLNSPITPRSPTSSPGCNCDRWGRDRRGKKVRVDCGGRSCGSSESDSDSARYKTKVVSLGGRGGGGEKRQGYVMRGGSRR